MKTLIKILTLFATISILFSSCKNIIKKAGKETAETIITEILETGGKKTLKEIASSNTIFRTLFTELEKSVSKNFAEGITVSNIGKDMLELVSKDFPNSRILLNLKRRTIECSAGSLKGSGPVNEFLNVLLPNMTYKVDGCYTYLTDKYGRVIMASGDRSKAYRIIQRNPQRNSDIQKKVIDDLDGISGIDDAGHLFSNTSGGPNELINQVPMGKNINRTGRWRELERIEEEAVKAGKQVLSERELLYKGTTKRPYAIKFTYIIDGQKMTRVIKNA